MFRLIELQAEYRTRREFYYRQTLKKISRSVDNSGIRSQIELADNNKETRPVSQFLKTTNAKHSQRLSNVPPKVIGQVRTLAFIPLRGWHSSLLPDLSTLGPVCLFDYNALGFRHEILQQFNELSSKTHRELNEKAWQYFVKQHEQEPFDWFFVYANGIEIDRNLVRRVREELKIPCVNMCLDDKQSWQGPLINSQRSGQIDIAPEFNLSWTSARVALDWYRSIGANPIYLPEGYCQQSYFRMEIEPRYQVSFIGQCYGFRPRLIRYLHRHGVEVEAFGNGWPNGFVNQDQQLEILNASSINLGFGGIGYSESLTNVKGRDFEIPAVGGGVYLTSFNPDLALHFQIGKEIVCYRNKDEMLELIRYYLAHPHEAASIAKAAKERCMAEHRWLHRYKTILNYLGILDTHSDTTLTQTERSLSLGS
jgi:spore maturation protein CgeB